MRRDDLLDPGHEGPLGGPEPVWHEEPRPPRESRRSDEALGLPKGSPPLAPWMRILLFVVGWILVLLGILGLFLPILQGYITLLMAAAVLSLVSPTAYRMLRWSLGRWPKVWRKVLGWRRRIHDRLAKWSGGDHI
jgi:uncharacterized protein